jgi:glycerol-3-phosphate dehydrogenase (NAD(P)+)
MSEIIFEILPKNTLAILSGPTFANDVALNLPTAVTLACENQILANRLSECLATPHFRIYASTDMIGAQIGGAVKNVLAIACGIIDGKKMGDNARAALLTRGLNEIIRLAKAKGAKSETLIGLSGLGDLTLTCNSTQSRNFTLGRALGQGEKLESILRKRNSVAEGVLTAESIVQLSKKLNIDMPICSAVNNILNYNKDIDQVIFSILNRPLIPEVI